MNYTIRQATHDDEPFLWEMLYQALYVPPGQPPLPREIVEAPAIGRYLRGWGRASDLALLAVEVETQQPAGAVWIRLMTGEDKGYGYVDDRTPELSIAVLPEHRGRGVGERLMKELLDVARVHYAAVSLSVSTNNPAANLYRRLGFETVNASENSLTMKKDLTGAELVSFFAKEPELVADFGKRFPLDPVGVGTARLPADSPGDCQRPG